MLKRKVLLQYLGYVISNYNMSRIIEDDGCYEINLKRYLVMDGVDMLDYIIQNRILLTPYTTILTDFDIQDVYCFDELLQLNNEDVNLIVNKMIYNHLCFDLLETFIQTNPGEVKQIVGCDTIEMFNTTFFIKEL